MTDLELSSTIVRVCEKAASLASVQWLTNAYTRVCGPATESSRNDFLASFSAAGRKMGSKLVQFPEGLLDEQATRVLSMRGIDELVRIALLIAEVARSSDVQGLVTELYVRGAEREKVAVLRALPLLPEPKRFTVLATEACRSSVQTVFEAIACDSPFAAQQFTELAFNQMVLKALFTETSVLRIWGLETRATEELKRMCLGYGDERRAASRPVPLDIDHVVALPTVPQAPGADGSQA
jgi:hypothetical protein